MNNEVLRIAILSDLHLGNARDELNWRGETTQRRNYLDVFAEFVEAERISADYIIMPGDISNKGLEEEFDEFKVFSDKISVALRASPDSIIIAPGNHDKNWEIDGKYKGEEVSERVSQSFRIFTEKTRFIFRGSGYCARSHSEAPYFKIWEDDRLYVLIINSAVDDYSDSRPHYGSVSTATINEIRQLLQSDENRIDGKIKICVCHHHPIQYHSPLNDIYPDFSIMSNSEGLLGLLHQYHFNFVIHGHKHIPSFHIHANELARPIVCFCAGSFSAALSYRYNGIATNLFHVLEVECASSSPPKGAIHSWSYLSGHGWIPGKEDQCGIESRVPFGYWLPFDQLKAKLKEIFQLKLQEKPHLLLSDVAVEFGDIKYIPSKVRRMVVESLAKDMQLEVYPRDDDILLMGR